MKKNHSVVQVSGAGQELEKKNKIMHECCLFVFIIAHVEMWRIN
jgi:hypothetical protein